MILVTGGTGFIGKALVRQLTESGYAVRILIRPSQQSPDFPRGVPVEVAVSSLLDERSLKVALVGVETVYHLASAESLGVHGSLLNVDIRGTTSLCRVMADSNVKRIFYVSHLGADRASAFPSLKAKAIAEEYIRRSGKEFTIIRSGILFGKGDQITTGLVQLAHYFPLVFLIPGEGETMLHPLWIEDLCTCLVWALELEELSGQTISVGGPEYISFIQLVQTIFERSNLHRTLINVPLPYLKIMTIVLESFLPGLPTTSFWMDYLATNRTSSLDTIPRIFNLMPSRFSHRLDYLADTKWNRSWLKLLRRKRRP
jgi:uncharacterized protein YbjT (DUF2867 family)